MTSYQRLKEENRQLKLRLHELNLDIRAVVNEPDGYRATIAKLNVEHDMRMEEAWVFGNRKEQNT